MIWSSKAADYSEGTTLQPDGTLNPNKIGCYVLTLEEVDEILKARKNK